MSLEVTQYTDDSGAAADQGRPPTVLVVDDDPQVRRLLRRRLEAAGYGVEEAWNGLVALEVYRNVPVDVVVADLVLPHMDGCQLITELQRICSTVRILAISGAYDLDIRILLADARRLGALRTLAKPFTTDQLLRAVGELMEEPLRAAS